MSELQQQLNAIQRNLEEHRKLISFVVVDADGHIKEWSVDAGLIPNDVSTRTNGTTIFEIVPEFIGLEQTLNEIATRKAGQFELPRIQRGDQRSDARYVTIRLLPFRDKGEVIVTFEDVTESATVIQRLMQDHNELELIRQKLAQSEKRYHTILENISDVVFTTDLEGTIKYINPRIQNLSQYTPDELVGQHFLTLVPEDQRKELESGYKKQVEDGVTETVHEFMLNQKKGGVRWVEQRVTLLREKGEITGLQGIMWDITSRKEAQETLVQYQRTLEQRNRELDAYNYSLAHDLKSPLTVMTSYAELLRMTDGDNLSEKGKSTLAQISETAFRMSDMINGLLMLGSIENTKYILEPMVLRPLITMAVEDNHKAIQKRGVTVTVAEDIPPAVGYGPWLEQLFDNLIGNAIKFIGKDNPSPTVEVFGETKGDRVRIAVRDNGLGISAKDQETIFDMFSRYHKDEARGTGLGLSIVKRIVEKCDGSITIESTVGEGTTFWIELPGVSVSDSDDPA